MASRPSRHATPTPSRPGTPLGSRRPSINPHASLPSLLLANSTIQSSTSPSQISIPQAPAVVGTSTITISSSPATGVLSSKASIIGDADSSSNSSVNGLIASSNQGSNEHINITITGEDDVINRSLRPPEEVAADAHKLREHLRRSLSRGHGE